MRSVPFGLHELGQSFIVGNLGITPRKPLVQLGHVIVKIFIKIVYNQFWMLKSLLLVTFDVMSARVVEKSHRNQVFRANILIQLFLCLDYGKTFALFSGPAVD